VCCWLQIVYSPIGPLSHKHIQCVPLATEPGISLIILPLLRILQRNLKRTTDTFLFISHTTNVLLFKFRCNIFICVTVIKEMPGSVASGTHCISFWTELDPVVLPVSCPECGRRLSVSVRFNCFVARTPDKPHHTHNPEKADNHLYNNRRTHNWEPAVFPHLSLVRGDIRPPYFFEKYAVDKTSCHYEGMTTSPRADTVQLSLPRNCTSVCLPYCVIEMFGVLHQPRSLWERLLETIGGGEWNLFEVFKARSPCTSPTPMDSVV